MQYHLARHTLIAACTLWASGAIAQTPTGIVPRPNADGTIVIEAEAMRLAAAEVSADAQASGGKAVKLLSAEAKGSIELALPKGQYVVNAFIGAEHESSDGFYLVANGKAQRTNARLHVGKWTYGAKFLIFSTGGSAPVRLQFASNWPGQPPGEAGMWVDRLEIAEFTHSAAQLERWAK